MKIQNLYNHAFTDDEFPREEQNEYLRNLGEHRSKRCYAKRNREPKIDYKVREKTLEALKQLHGSFET